jgi:hypothetical protein
VCVCVCVCVCIVNKYVRNTCKIENGRREAKGNLGGCAGFVILIVRVLKNISSSSCNFTTTYIPFCEEIH